MSVCFDVFPNPNYVLKTIKKIMKKEEEEEEEQSKLAIAVHGTSEGVPYFSCIMNSMLKYIPNIRAKEAHPFIVLEIQMTFTIQLLVQDFLIYQLKNILFITKQVLLKSTGQIICHLQQMQFGLQLKVKEAK